MQITLIWILNGGGVSELCVIKQESERQIERERELTLIPLPAPFAEYQALSQ